GLVLWEDESNLPAHIVDMDELDAILQILSSIRQHAREALAFFPHALRAIAAAVWGAAKRAHQIILHAGSRKDMRAQHVNTASPQRRRALLHHAIRFHFVNRIRQSVAAEREIFRDQSRQVRTIRRNAARKNEFLDHRNVAVGFSDRFHHSRRTRHVDLPHAVNVQYPRANWIDHERQVHDGYSTSSAQKQVQFAARFFLPQIHPFEAERKIGLRWVQIDSNNIEPGQLRQKAKAEIPGDSRDQNRWFRFGHLLRTRVRNLRHRLYRSRLDWRL